MPGDYENLSGPYNNLQFPDLTTAQADPQRVISYRNRIFSKYAAYRRRLEARWAVNYQYFIDHQWLDLFTAAIPDGVAGYSLRMLQSDKDGIPRPVTNILAPNIEIELATYAKRKFMPKPVAATSDPWDIEAAKRMQAVLKHRSKTEHWNIARQRAGLHLAVSGTGFTRSWWDLSYSYETEEIASPFAKTCQSCQATVASPTISTDMKGQMKGGSEALQAGKDPMTLMMGACPECGAPGMQDAVLNEGDLDKRDIFGRRLGVTIPKGRPAIEAWDPFTLYPENSGVGVTYDKWQVMHSVTSRSLDWIIDRHPQFKNDIRPDSQTELLRRNPLVGEFAAFSYMGPTIDSSIYMNHALYYEMVALPNSRMPKGMLIRSCNNLILEAGDLLWEYTDPEMNTKVQVPKVSYNVGVFIERPGEFFGHGMIDRGRSLQNRLNGRDAQIIDIHERLANPHVLAATDMNLTGPEWFEGGYSGKKLQYERSVLAPGDKPQVFGGVSPPSGVWQERDRILNDVRFILGPAEIEQGMSPKNISTTSGLQLESEHAQQRRGPREDSVDHISYMTWDHVMRMEQGFRVSESEYEVEDERSKAWRTEVYTRVKLQGKMRMEIEKSSYAADSIYKREAIREAQASGLVIVRTPADRKRILEAMGLPTDLNPDEDFQVNNADKKWSHFVRDGVIPVMDPTLDNPIICWDVLATYLLGEDGRRLAGLANWEFVLPLLTDWEVMLGQKIQLDVLSRQQYGMWTTEEDARAMYAQAMVQFQQAQVAFPQMQQDYQGIAMASQAMGAMPPPAPLPPVEPIKPIFLPRPMNLKLLNVWNELLQAATIPPGETSPKPPEEFKVVLDSYLRFRAVAEAYRLLSQGWTTQGPPMLPMQPQAPMGAEGGAAMATPPANVPNPPNAPNPPNIPSPGTSQALAASNMTPPGSGTVVGG